MCRKIVKGEYFTFVRLEMKNSPRVARLSLPLYHSIKIYRLIPYYLEMFHYYEGESIKNQPNLFLGEIDLFFFDVIAL